MVLCLAEVETVRMNSYVSVNFMRKIQTWYVISFSIIKLLTVNNHFFLRYYDVVQNRFSAILAFLGFFSPPHIIHVAEIKIPNEF